MILDTAADRPRIDVSRLGQDRLIINQRSGDVGVRIILTHPEGFQVANALADLVETMQ